MHLNFPQSHLPRGKAHGVCVTVILYRYIAITCFIHIRLSLTTSDQSYLTYLRLEVHKYYELTEPLIAMIVAVCGWWTQLYLLSWLLNVLACSSICVSSCLQWSPKTLHNARVLCNLVHNTFYSAYYLREVWPACLCHFLIKPTTRRSKLKVCCGSNARVLALVTFRSLIIW